MPSKPLKVNVPVQADTVEEAIADLQGKYLRATKRTCRVVQQATDYNVARVCQPLIDDWRSGKVAYGNGTITLSFTGGELAQVADLVIYKPAEGERFLYSKPADETVTQKAQQLSLDELTAEFSRQPDLLPALVQMIATLMEGFTELAANQRAMESRLSQLLSDYAGFKRQVESQSATFAQLLAHQLNSANLPLSQRLDALESQLQQLVAQLSDLADIPETETAHVPKTEAEWRQLIRDTWGTVGDYEKYSDTYRAANAETPLFDTPDWIALCELEWARKLSPTLATLYKLIYDKDGIGYEGANILHQFGRHIDPHTGERYYIYRRSGFTAYDALWQMVRNPQNSWLPEIRRITLRVARLHPDVLQLFGWEQEAIAGLESVVERAYREQQSTHDSGRTPYQTRPPGTTLRDYLAVLNLGPFTPITVEAIKRAYRQAMKTAHPDTGGSKEQAQRVNEAYEAVMRHYFPKANSTSPRTG
jgi:hypothetical protein